MTAEEKLAHQRLSVLELAQTLGNVSEACRQRGMSRTQFYEYKRRFLTWLEEQIGAKIDDLTGKTTLQGYLGDYQKGEPETPFEEFYDRLHRNRSKIAVNLSDAVVKACIRDEYEKSLAVLLPIKRQLAHTDALIDQVVYRLYGLTEEEIAIVEGRA